MASCRELKSAFRWGSVASFMLRLAACRAAVRLSRIRGMMPRETRLVTKWWSVLGTLKTSVATSAGADT